MYKVKIIHSTRVICHHLNGGYHRLDGPAVVWANGDKEWYLNDKFHRLDGPACEYANGSKEWYLNGFRHRLDGPAVEYSSGRKEYWVDGEQFSESKWERMFNYV